MMVAARTGTSYDASKGAQTGGVPPASRCLPNEYSSLSSVSRSPAWITGEMVRPWHQRTDSLPLRCRLQAILHRWPYVVRGKLESFPNYRVRLDRLLSSRVAVPSYTPRLPIG